MNGKLNINLVVVASCLTFPCFKKKPPKTTNLVLESHFFGPFVGKLLPIFSPTRWGWVQWRMCWRLTSQGGDPLRRAWWWWKPRKRTSENKTRCSPKKLKHGYRSSRKKCLFATLVYTIYGIPKSPASEQNPATKSLVDTGLPDLHAWKLWDDDSQFNLHIPGSSFGVKNMCGNPPKKNLPKGRNFTYLEDPGMTYCWWKKSCTSA